MSKTTESNISQIVLPTPKPMVQTPAPQLVGKPIPRPEMVAWAPVWFYSALNWLGKSYYDTGNAQQSFSTYMAGSDVDPYAQIGRTRLFVISLIRNMFRLTLAADVNSLAPMSGGTLYPNTDQGIRQMYLDLAANPIFPAVKYCYIPGRVSPALSPNPSAGGLKGGYDPATGLRTVVFGSAVAQVVPLDDFLKTHNEQIYDSEPTIVPVAAALVYDVSHYNTLGATSFVLPVYYSPDQVSAGTYYVNKFSGATSLANAPVTYGQTVAFPGGPGYNDAAATSLKLQTAAVLSSAGHNFTVYTYDTAKVATISTLSPKVETGIMSFTYSGDSPASAFAHQQIIGFYCDASWKTSLGLPIYDFGPSNPQFTASAVALNAPTVVYDPTHPCLNGGSLQNVVQKLTQAKYLYPPDQLVSMTESAAASRNTGSGAGLSVTTAALKFNLSSTPAAPIVDQLNVPVIATVTTTPPPVTPPQQPGLRLIDAVPIAVAAPATVAATGAPTPLVTNLAVVRPISVTGIAGIQPQPIGTGANTPSTSQPAPVTVEVALSGFVPREALSGTGIGSIENGTSFPQQDLGPGAALNAAKTGRVINLMERAKPAFALFDLPLASAGMNFTIGISYVLSATGTSLTARGSDGSSQSSALAASVSPDPSHTFVGAMVYSTGLTSVRLYPKLSLLLPAPTVGTHGVQQGVSYSVRLTIGTNNSQYDLMDANHAVTDSNITVLTPAPSDKSTPQPGDLYFGSFIGGAAQMTVWSVPVFLMVVPSRLIGAAFNGDVTIDAQSSGLPGYQLQITDSSLFIYSNINVDTGAAGSLSAANVYLASAVINSAPDDRASAAFAPSRLLMGLVRQVQMGGVLKYVFVPEDDSIVIGKTRYMVSVINLDGLDVAPNSRPYPPVFWPQSRYWQFANRHNPYIDVAYTGATQDARIARAQSDTARIGLRTAQAQEPMHMYLDANREEMTIWPIYAFPLAAETQTLDVGQLKAIASTILEILGTTAPSRTQFTPGPLDAEQVTLPDLLLQSNPYTTDVATSAASNPTLNGSIASTVIEPSPSGRAVTNLAPTTISNTSINGLAARKSMNSLSMQKATANLAIAKSMEPAQVIQAEAAVAGVQTTAAISRRYQPIYGFSVYKPGTGEAYIIEVVDSDLAVPDQLPNPNTNVTYDPYYVRVVFLNTQTAYNMSIIVPSMVHDQHGYLARQATPYSNVLSKTDELKLGYMYSLYDATNNFDGLTFTAYGTSATLASAAAAASTTYLFTNIPYSTRQAVSFSPLTLFEDLQLSSTLARRSFVSFDTSRIKFRPFSTPPAYFVCRRANWSADCHLMQSTHPEGKSIYLAFGGGDLVPFRLDTEVQVDKRSPAHLYKLTHTFADKQYDSAKAISIRNQPYFVAVTTQGGVVEYRNFSINSTAGTADLQITSNQALKFPTECYVIGQASTTLTSIADVNAKASTSFADTGNLMNLDAQGNLAAQQFQLIAYNNLVYLIRAVSNVPALGIFGGSTSGLLVDTFVPTSTGNLALAQAARFKRSGLSYFGSSYTPTTMVDSLDTLDFTSITGQTFYAPTLFIPIPELDAAKGIVADLSNFLGEQIWTFIYSEIVAQPGATVNGVAYPNGFNLDAEGKSVLSLQKLHFVYDPQVVMFTPNDLAHKYPLQPKQQVLALTNGQIQEGICWRSANLQLQRQAPSNICAQQLLPAGAGMDRPNIIYSSHNRAVQTSIASGYKGMSVNSVVALSGVVYNIEESAATSNDQVGSSLISAVSSGQNMLLGVLFDYDNNDLGTLNSYDPAQSTKGIVFLNGYLGATGYSFSSPDHFDVNDVLPSQVPLIEQVAAIMGQDVAFYNTDVSLPRQFWSMTCDTFTAAGLPNYIANVPPAMVDPTFTNRTRSLVLSLQNPVHPTDMGLMDTYSSVVSANLHLQNGITGAIFLSKKADRDVASIGSNPSGSATLYGLPTKYDFFLFSRDHYTTLDGCSFDLIDQGYAMCLVDDGSGTGTKVAKYFIDTDGNYNELYAYVLYSPAGGIIESSSFTLKVTLGSPATPGNPETPNNVNPQDLAAQINKVSNLIYAAFGPSSGGQPPAFLPIQAIGGSVQAAPIVGPPGFDGYSLNVAAGNRQPVRIPQIYSGNITYPIAGSTTIVPINLKSGKPVPFSGSISNGLDRQVSVALLQSKDLTSFIPRPTVPPGPSAGVYGGNGLGAVIGKQYSCAFQGSGAIPPAIASNPTPGTVMKADDTVFYTFNGVTNSVMDSSGKSATASGSQYFTDTTDPLNPVYAVVTLPKFVLNGNTYTVNLSTTLTNGVTSRYSLVVGGKSYLFGPDNAHVTVDRTTFTFNPAVGGNYSVSYSSVDDPVSTAAPSPITLTPFSIAAGGVVSTTDVFNTPAHLENIVLGVTGRQYAYDPIHATVTITQGANTTTVPIATGLTFTSNSGYGYVISFSNDMYSVNASPMFPYSASTSGTPATYALTTAPQMFALDGNFYSFNQDANGGYVSVTGNSQTYLVNPYQFSINGQMYIINTNVQPNTVIGGGNVYPMTAGNTQFVLNGVQYTIALKQNSLNGATISGQFNITQGNVVVLENYVYELDTLNGQIVGNGTTYPLTTSGFTYTIATSDRSFTVTTEPNACTVAIGNVVYQINNTTVVGDGITYPILPYRTFVDGGTKYTIGLDGTVSLPPPFTLSGAAPFTRSTFTDGGTTYTVNDVAAFDGTNYFLISGSPAQFKPGALTYTIRTDGVAISAGPAKTYIVNTTGPLTPNQFTFGTKTISFGRPQDMAAFDGSHYYAIANNTFTDSTRGVAYTLSGNTAVHEGNSYEIFSNLGQGSYFQVPGGPAYYVNIPVADVGSASGDIFSVFPISGGQFSIPLIYTITVAGSVATVSASTFAVPTAVATLKASGGKLTGGFFQDPVTKITYTCFVSGSDVTFVDSNNAEYPFPVSPTTNTFVVNVVVATGVSLAVDSQATPAVYPVLNNQFVTAGATYTINVPVAYPNAAGPYFRIVNGRFIVPRTAPASSVAYTMKGGSVVKGYVISIDDQFSVDGNVVYTIDAVNVVKSSNQATLSGAEPNQTLTAGAITYALDSSKSLATTQPAGLKYNTATKQFAVNYSAVTVTYTVGTATVTDDRHPGNSFTATVAGSRVTFTDTVSGVTFTFDSSGNNQISAVFVYTNHFFIDAISNITYYIDEADKRVEFISYIPETTQYAFTPADGNIYLIHYSNVSVVFPVISGANVNAGVGTVGSDIFTVHVDEVTSVGGGAGIPINLDSFEINGNLYTITGTPAGADYSACKVVGDAIAPKPFLSANTFKLTDPNVTYTVQLDSSNLPVAVLANYTVQPSRDLLTVNDSVYIITYNTVSTGSLLGQGQSAIPISNSSFTLSNPFDSTKAKFLFADLNIFDAASVVGQFNVYLAPTFFIGAATYTLDPVNLVVTDNNKRPYPLLANPTMFGINGVNYVIDTNRVPHAIIGNNNVSPLSTDVTVESGLPIPNSTFALNGQVYAYTEDAQRNLLAITGTKSYMISQPGLTFKLDSSLIFTLHTTPPAAGNYAGTTVPIGTITAGTLTLNLYAGQPESGGADFFMYKNVMYGMVKSGTTYVAVQKSYTVYASKPAGNQQQLAVFNLNGTTYLITDGTTTGVGPAAGINPGTMWAQTATSAAETQFGLVYGFTPQPTNVTRTGSGVFQFQAADSSGNNTLYDILYTAGGNANMVKVDVPSLLPTFMQSAPFTFVKAYPLTFETGGYNAFTTAVEETATPNESFAAAFKTPVSSTDPLIDQLISAQGDFSLEFWHSLPLTNPVAYHPVRYSASSTNPLVYNLDVDFENTSDIYVQINNTVLHGSATPPAFSSGWRHFGLSYTQPYVILCQGGGFEVKQASNYNFNRDFSIAMTFAASDVTTGQGLLYKGTGSDITPPQLNMSYRVGIANNAVTLQLTDGDSNISQVFTGQAVLAPDNFYEVIITKRTTTAATNADSPDPYASPFDLSDLNSGASAGSNFSVDNLPSGGGTIDVSNIAAGAKGTNTKLGDFLQKIGTTTTKQYTVTIAVRTINDNGTYGAWSFTSTDATVPDDSGLLVKPTGSAHLLIGSAYDDNGYAMPLGGGSNAGNIRNVYLFNSAINREGIKTSSGIVDIPDASSGDLAKAGLIGYWKAQYDPNGVISNPFDQTAVALSTNSALARLAPLKGHELEGAVLYINGYPVSLDLVTSGVPSSITGYVAGNRELTFNAGVYRLEEISMWQMARQEYQVIDDMFGRLIPSNEPFLQVYLSGSFEVQAINAPILPLKKYIDNIVVQNAVTSMDMTFSPASLDLSGCPAVGRCGPLVTPNLYTPPGLALTVCDTPPSLTTYSVTLNTVTGSLAGEVNEAYVYVKDNVLTLYAGKKVGDLVLTWVSQEQGNVQLIGYIEGAPPCPMANLTNKPGTGATSIAFTAPTSVTLKYASSDDYSDDTKWSFSDSMGVQVGLNAHLSPLGFGVAFKDGAVFQLSLGLGTASEFVNSSGDGSAATSTEKLDESNKYTVKLQGAMAPYTNDLFMSNLNTLTTASNTPGNPSSKTAILPNPNLGGFTTSNSPSPLPKAPTEEKFGSRMFLPSPYGQAFVTSQTLDVYQQTLLQTNTVFGFVKVPNVQIPRDVNIVSFRMSSKYIRPGVLDGVVGYVYNPATLPNGTRTYTTSTGQMEVLYDKNFAPGEIGHNASYMRLVETYKLKKQIDQQAYNALALYQTAYNTTGSPDDSSLTPGLDFYNEYVWCSRGGTQEVKHTFSTSFDQVYTTTTVSSGAVGLNFNLKLEAVGVTIADAKLGWTDTAKDTLKYSYNTTGTTSFDITASFDGIDTDTQMRYACNNDAHFVMNNNSMFNPNNQSELNLVIGSDGLVYNIVPSVSSGAGIPVSDNIDDSQTYAQPQPAYTSGNADGLTGALEPYDRPGKMKTFRSYAFFLQPSQENSDDFWNTVVDPVWLANSQDDDADALRSAFGNVSIPWRLLYRVTYADRYLPPVSNVGVSVPQITPVMAVPVLNPASDFLFKDISQLPRPAHNPLNDIEANVVLAAPTASGASAAGTVLPNNVIPFDLVKGASSVVNWGDTANAKLLSQLITSVLGTNTVAMSPSALPGSAKVADVMDPVSGAPLYTIYTDPNGLTVNVPTNFGITVYQDVNGNPIQYFDGKTYHSLQADYVASPDGTVMYYIQPPSTYDQSAFSLVGDYDPFGYPGDQWRYFLVSGMSSNMTAEPTVAGSGPFLLSGGAGGYTGFTIAPTQHAVDGSRQVQGYVLVQGVLQWPHLNTNAETFADVQVYKAMSLLDTFPIGDPEVMIAFLKAQYPAAPFVRNEEINMVLARNIVSYLNAQQQALIPE